MSRLTKGAMMGAAGVASGDPVYVEDVFSTYLYEGNGADGGSQTITNGINLGDNVTTYLTGKTITNIGSTIDAGTLSAVNDGVVPSSNTGYCYTAGTLDIYVDMGSATVVTGYLIAPQGSAPSSIFNTIEGFYVKASNDASTWTTIATFSSNGTSTPGWQPGVLRPFVFSNTTGYRYWRLQSTDASNDSLTEWAMLVDTPNTGEGGLVWLKKRSNSAGHYLTDTARGTAYQVRTDSVAAQSGSVPFLSFNSDGFTIGADSEINSSLGHTMSSWTFRKARGFFDVVTWTGNDVTNRAIPHSLGSTPGCIMVKSLSTREWYVWHRSINPTWTGGTTEGVTTGGNQTGALVLNNGNQFASNWGLFTYVNDTAFGVYYNNSDINSSPEQFVAYVFAHDAQIFGETKNQSIIKCGSYTGNASTSNVVNLGWEPQWLLIKRTDADSRDWHLFDTTRGMSGVNTKFLYPNTTGIENSVSVGVQPLSTGFEITADGQDFNNLNSPHLYIAIRRGPMRTPTDATKVFTTNVETEIRSATAGWTSLSGFVTDAAIVSRNLSAEKYTRWSARLTGGRFMSPDADTNESTTLYFGYDTSNGIKEATSDLLASSDKYIDYHFSRAPGFFDVVTYTGNSSSPRAITHNLGVAPEMMIFKKRLFNQSWWVYHHGLSPSATSRLILNSNQGPTTSSTDFGSSDPTSSVFYVGNNTNDGGGSTYIAYLFASLDGISKVGNYTGDGGYKVVNCGFTNGARFILIKRADSTVDNWYVWDSVRGINSSANDPYIVLNSTASEVTNTDYVYPSSSGFTVNPGSPVNVLNVPYVFLAIA